MLVHHRVTPSIKVDGSHLYTWVERGTVRVKCLTQEHNRITQPGLKPGLHDSETSALTMRPLLLPGFKTQTIIEPLGTFAYFSEISYAVALLSNGRKAPGIISRAAVQSEIQPAQSPIFIIHEPRLHNKAHRGLWNTTLSVEKNSRELEINTQSESKLRTNEKHSMLLCPVKQDVLF